MKHRSPIAVLVVAFLVSPSSLVQRVTAASEVTRYIAPAALGTGDGSSAADAAVYTDSAFWSDVRTSLGTNPVTVRWLDGQYNSAGLELTDMGDPYHQLTLTGDTDHGAILNAYTSTMLKFRGVQNTVVRDLNFTDPSQPDPDLTDNIPGYGLQITSNGSTPSRKIVLDSLTFTDMTQVYYGATGTTHDTYDVSLRNSTFSNVGYDGHAHMMYNAYDPHHISVYNNTFTDSKGDYVRFRDDTEYGSVIGNTFVSSSSVYNRPMVAVPLFNDDDPENLPDPPYVPNYEHFGTHFQIHGNEFTYNTTGGTSTQRSAIAFYHRGFDPPGYNYLLTPEEGAIVESGTTQEKKDFLRDHIEVDGDMIRVYDNTYTNERYRGAFNSAAAYGAVSKGWSGWGDVYDTWNTVEPTFVAGDKLVDWQFDAADNGGAGWTNNSYQAVEDAGWRIRPGYSDDAKTFVDTDASLGGANGLMWVRDWIDGETISVDYLFEQLPAGRIEWTMGLAGSDSQLALYNGRAEEGGLSILGVQLIDSDTIRILGDPTETQDKTFPGVDLSDLNNWQWEWSSDPDGVNGTATLSFQTTDSIWHSVYSGRAYDANIVPDSFWIESVGDVSQNSYIVLDSMTITALEALIQIDGDLNRDGYLDQWDWFIFRDNNPADLRYLNPIESYTLGDLDGDGDSDTDDFVLFRTFYLMANGEGSFAAMLRGVPEPSASLLFLLGILALAVTQTRLLSVGTA